MDFSLSPVAEDLRDRLLAFMDEHVLPGRGGLPASRWRTSATRTPTRR